MKKGTIGCLLGLLLLAGLVLFLSVGWYNQLVALDEGVSSAWAQVESAYQRRADLIPNLVSTVRGAADFEQETLTQVVEARAKVGQVQVDGVPNAAQLEQFQQAQDGLTSALSRLLVVVERYPELKATQAFRDLQVQLEGTENRVNVERNRFNEAVQAYNRTVRSFPTSLVASLRGFESRSYFSSDSGASEAPKVEF